jgi:hypothetical protein
MAIVIQWPVKASSAVWLSNRRLVYGIAQFMALQAGGN